MTGISWEHTVAQLPGICARDAHACGNAGTRISAVPFAARWHNERLVGAEFDPEALICRLSP
jgi:hypothetical protein